jgi:hypothetical protein
MIQPSPSSFSSRRRPETRPGSSSMSSRHHALQVLFARVLEDAFAAARASQRHDRFAADTRRYDVVCALSQFLTYK